MAQLPCIQSKFNQPNHSNQAHLEQAEALGVVPNGPLIQRLVYRAVQLAADARGAELVLPAGVECSLSSSKCMQLRPRPSGRGMQLRLRSPGGWLCELLRRPHRSSLGQRQLA